MNKPILLIIIGAVLLQSCATKKEILYFQDAQTMAPQKIQYSSPSIQANDILDIKVSALVPETAIPYNQQLPTHSSSNNLDLIKLQGYLVSTRGTIMFPVLGSIVVKDMTTAQLETRLQHLLEEGGHLVQPTISARLLNAKVTVLGEVQRPGTYSFTEQQISLPQALGYAGDLTINGKRNNIMLIREEAGMRTVTHIDLTRTEWFNSPYYYVKPNDFIVVNPNATKVKSAGFIGNTGTLISVASVILTSLVLITR